MHKWVRTLEVNDLGGNGLLEKVIGPQVLAKTTIEFIFLLTRKGSR